MLQFQSEMAIGVGAGATFLDGKMEIDSADIEPEPATGANCFGLGDLVKAEESSVERASVILGTGGNRDVDVGYSHAGIISRGEVEQLPWRYRGGDECVGISRKQ